MSNTDYVKERTVDVVIPVYRPGNELERLLKRLSEQKKKIGHIFLMHTEDGVDLEWTQKLCHNVQEYMVYPEEFDHGGTRDRGIRNSCADIVVCMTQDALPADRELIDALIRPFQGEGIVASYARQLPRAECSLLERCVREFNYPERSRVKSAEDIKELGIKTFFCSNVCAAYDREKYLALGGFEKKTIFNEDMIFAAHAVKNGYKIAYAAEAKVVHSHNYTNIQQLKRNFDLAVSQAQHPEIFRAVKSESEGIRMVMRTFGRLVRSRHPLAAFELILQSGFKYLGYRLGKNYKKLPAWLILKFTMNPRYWK